MATPELVCLAELTYLVSRLLEHDRSVVPAIECAIEQAREIIAERIAARRARRGDHGPGSAFVDLTAALSAHRELRA